MNLTIADVIQSYGPTIVGTVLACILGIIAKWFHDFVSAVKSNTIAVIKLTTHFEILEKRVERIPKLEDDIDEAHMKIRVLEKTQKEKL